ncbi:GNAT superfamily N-acetyltransferase [Bosea sp. BE125]|uniref:GNAT family N-acetyltransferase n=1 Tax=Bosea sp. BE125 TaxID=2817909 RepID=UPI0028632E3F|nr:GNAT family N-acetyltransferase [Bosea sp. BE125]MDR6871732.1 GNAT superfamily N-acetyltransferase [Bosea sp. BE125]
MSDEFLYTTTDDPRARPLVDELIHEYDSRYGDVPGREGAVVELHRYPPALFQPPHGNFLLLIRNGETIGGGGFKLFDAQTAELKRVWTRHDLRRQGLARKVLIELEAQVLRQGYSRIFLTTGFRQPEAEGLYLGHGYSRLEDPEVDSGPVRILPFEKHLGRGTDAPYAPHQATASPDARRAVGA